MLLFVALLLTWGQLQHRPAPTNAIAEAGLESRIFELHWALEKQLGNMPEIAFKTPKNEWNIAVECVLLAEGAKKNEAESRLNYAPQGAFRTCWEAAYAFGPLPTPDDLAIATSGLGRGLASRYLEATLSARDGHDADGMKSDALANYRLRAFVFFTALPIFFLGALAGLGLGIWMWAKRRPIEAPPQFNMSATSAVRVCLGWYIAFLLSASIASWVNSAIPLGIWLFPFAYALHAAFGIAFICLAEKAGPLDVWKKISPAGQPWIRHGIRFFLVALGTLLVFAYALSPFMPDADPQQRELARLIQSSNGIVAFLALFGTIAILGPAFEEIFFRGFLLSVMRRRFSAMLALALSSALFGAFHLQLQTLPALLLLGGILGLAFLRTRDIKTAILVHGCWNGGVFMFQRLLY
jgi:membrane protease YdiL (CAAX protease family)